MNVSHPIPPVFDNRSEILILGSFPSVKSRAEGFFYGNPQNRFWRALAAVFGDAVPATVPGKKAFLLAHRVALYDVLASCEIEGSADAGIKDPVPADLSEIFSAAPIRRVFTNGKTATALYLRFQQKKTGVPATPLPSTSPANAAFSLPRLIAAWQCLRCDTSPLCGK